MLFNKSQIMDICLTFNCAFIITGMSGQSVQYSMLFLPVYALLEGMHNKRRNQVSLVTGRQT